MVALVDESTGIFTAHTKEEMIGIEASTVLDESVLNRAYQGFTEYDNKDAYLLGTMIDFMVPVFLVFFIFIIISQMK